MGRTVAQFVAVAGCAVLALAPAGRCEDGSADEMKRLAEDLVSGDAARQKAATQAIRLRGPAAALDLLRPALRSAGGPGEQAIVDAIVAIGVDESLAHLYSHQTAWPGNRRGVEDFVAKLRERRPPRAAKSVRLTAATLDEPRRLPPFAEHRIADVVPSRLVGADLRATEVEGKLRIDTRGDGRQVTTVDPSAPKAVDVGPPPGRKVLVHRRVDAWFAGPASLLAGKLDGESVELLDADLDGTFDGMLDLVALGGAPFQRRKDAEFVHTAGGTATWRLTSGRGVATLEVTPEPVPQGVDPALLRTVTALNGWRRDVGLPPTFLDVPRSAQCQAHAEYWRLNGYTGHTESSEHPGYSKEGAFAGRASSVCDSPDPVYSVLRLTSTILHRKTALGAPRYGLGVGTSIGSCLWGGTMRADDLPGPILVPGPGQRRVPRRCESEIPPPTREPEFYAARRGYPVTVGHEGLWTVVTGARIDLWPADDASSPPLPGETFSRETPYLDGDPREPTTTFVPRAVLRRGTWHHARFTAVADGKPVEIRWSFETE